MWLVMSNGNRAGPRGLQRRAARRRRGRRSAQVPLNPSGVTRTTVGSGTFAAFTDASNGSFSYTVNGVTQAKPIARYIYASPTTVCQ